MRRRNSHHFRRHNAVHSFYPQSLNKNKVHDEDKGREQPQKLEFLCIDCEDEGNFGIRTSLDSCLVV
jgi:hypothetical protein